MKVRFNDGPAHEILLEDGWKTYTLKLEGQGLERGLNKVHFYCGGSVRTEDDFGGAWTNGALKDYLDRMYLPGQGEDEKVLLEWEQDNTKFRGSPVSFALDSMTVRALQ